MNLKNVLEHLELSRKQFSTQILQIRSESDKIKKCQRLISKITLNNLDLKSEIEEEKEFKANKENQFFEKKTNNWHK